MFIHFHHALSCGNLLLRLVSGKPSQCCRHNKFLPQILLEIICLVATTNKLRHNCGNLGKVFFSKVQQRKSTKDAGTKPEISRLKTSSLLP